MRLNALIIALGLLLSPAAASAQGQQPAREFKAGAITVAAPWARATPGGAKVGGVFLEIRAAEGTDDKLIAARSPASAVVELHDHVNDNGVMRMRRIETIPIKGTQAVTLKPGGLHVMLMELKSGLRVGGEVELTLVFEKAGELTVRAPIEPVGATGPGEHGSGSGRGSSGGHGSGVGKQ